MKIKFKSLCQQLGKREPDWLIMLSKRAELVSNEDINEIKSWNTPQQRPSACLAVSIPRTENLDPIDSILYQHQTNFDKNIQFYASRINAKDIKEANRIRKALLNIIKMMKKRERQLVLQHIKNLKQ